VSDDTRILFDHIAVGVRRVADVTSTVVGELGGRFLEGGPAGEFVWWQWSFDGGGRLEVLEPYGPPGGFVHRFLDRRGPGVHHVTFKVPSLEDCCRRAEESGYAVVGYDDREPSWKEAFLHPKQAQGIVVQFAESHPELRDPATLPRFDPPPEPPAAAPPVRLVGLRLRSHDRELARRQWRELLAGEEEERDGLLVYRWSDSPLRLAVEIETTGEVGPRFLEIGGEREVDDGPRPELGTRLVTVDSDPA
jgi:hypothetical protein